MHGCTYHCRFLFPHTKFYLVEFLKFCVYNIYNYMYMYIYILFAILYVCFHQFCCLFDRLQLKCNRRHMKHKSMRQLLNVVTSHRQNSKWTSEVHVYTYMYMQCTCIVMMCTHIHIQCTYNIYILCSAHSRNIYRMLCTI